MGAVMQFTEMPDFSRMHMPFIHETELAISTVPSESYLIFSSDEVVLPPELTFDEGLVSAPFETKLQSDMHTFTVTVVAVVVR